MGGTIKRVATGVATGGLSEFTRIGKGDAFGMDLATRALGFRGNNPDLPTLQGGQSPTDLLSNTGGAPVLANILLGVDPKEALAGFFGKTTKDGSWNEFLGTLSQKDYDAITSVSSQLGSIANDRKLRDQAVQKVIDDYPNLMKQVAQDRAQSGQEFDEVTKGYMQQALGDTAARYAAGGNLSSGAANEAFARVGNENALNKLNYMGQREASSYQQNLAGFNARLSEVNALRDFQNTLLGNKVSEGFSANHANLGRIFNTQMTNYQGQLQQNQIDQQSRSNLLGSAFQLGGTVLGASMFGPLGASVGGQAGNRLSGSFNQNAPKTYTTSYGRVLGG